MKRWEYARLYKAWVQPWLMPFLAGALTGASLGHYFLNQRIEDLSCRIARMETLATSAAPLEECAAEDNTMRPVSPGDKNG